MVDLSEISDIQDAIAIVLGCYEEVLNNLIEDFPGRKHIGVADLVRISLQGIEVKLAKLNHLATLDCVKQKAN